MADGKLTADELLGRVADPAYQLVRTARILIAPHDLTDRHDRLNTEFARASKDQSIANRSAEIARQLVELEDEIDGYWVEFKVRALPRKGWADLLAAHPPTKEQARLHSDLSFNPETFPAAAIAACLVEPEMTLEQVQILENGTDGEGGLTDAQFSSLFNAVVSVNVSGLAAPKSLAAGVARRLSEQSEPQPITSGFHALSSSDES